MPANPSYVLCKECGHDLPPPEALKGPYGRLLAAEHRAHHADWVASHEPKATIGAALSSATECGHAWRAYATELVIARRRDRADLEDRLRDTKADLRDAQDRIEQLEADLDHERRFPKSAMDS